ncbi:LysR family transcriptional regulator [Tsukamurella tyrosinosolvens]|nr:LysR family transcriptional regulator [Tsukamurella tyrosinosolvens]WEL93749.1 LysR family transcriptional regulator [Tsukamurella tyrosinosolvens]
MSEIDRFRLVLAVARTRSISEVALLTGLSQPTVTLTVMAAVVSVRP